MKKRIVWISFAASLIILFSAFFILKALSAKEWKSGLYFEPQITLYSVNGHSAEFEIAGYYVGDTDPASVYKEGTVFATLSNGNETVPLNLLAISAIQNEHYYDIDFLFSCELHDDVSSFDALHITSDKIKGFDAVIDGPIIFQRFDGDYGFIKDDKGSVFSYMMASRAGGYVDFLYCIENKSDKPLFINSLLDYCEMMQDNRIRVISNFSADGTIDLNGSKEATFPMTISSGDAVAFHYSVETYDNSYLFYQPAFKALYNEKEYVLCFPMQSNYPFVFLDDLSVLDLIKNS